MPNEVNYEQRYCAFVDILGFRGLIKRIDNGLTVERMRDILSAAHRPRYSPFEGYFQGSDFRVQSISDAVCISARDSAAGLTHLLSAVMFLSLDLLEEGQFVRGAIVKERLYHDNQIVFGPALIDAYELESTIARYPRIVVRSDVAREAKAYADDERYDSNLSRQIARSDDGPYFVDILSDVERTGGDDPGETIDKYEAMALQAQMRLEESVDNPSHFEKARWFARYWNKTARRLNLYVITGPGVDQEPVAWGD
jgi:hypothetical protein